MASTETPVTSLSTRGRLIRLLVTVVGAGLLLAGTFWGEDDHFPFGPFKMYASAVDPDAPTVDTRLEATDAAGATVPLTERNTGIRRAEIEGQIDRFRAEPELLRVAADAYASRNPDAPALTEVRIVIRWHEVRDFTPTGDWEEEVVATWRP
ncbi:MAG TPA: hypothetical protein VKZ74_03420 [Natronosporangium sp.]|nr:hypothetical protein [Natronosporangium sp.]